MTIEPKELWLNLFRDNKRGWMNAEQCFDNIEETYEGILEGQNLATYQYTVHIWTIEGVKHSEIYDLTQDAFEWRAECDAEAKQNNESFIYGNSAGRRP